MVENKQWFDRPRFQASNLCSKVYKFWNRYCGRVICKKGLDGCVLGPFSPRAYEICFKNFAFILLTFRIEEMKDSLLSKDDPFYCIRIFSRRTTLISQISPILWPFCNYYRSKSSIFPRAKTETENGILIIVVSLPFFPVFMRTCFFFIILSLFFFPHFLKVVWFPRIWKIDIVYLRRTVDENSSRIMYSRVKRTGQKWKVE